MIKYLIWLSVLLSLQACSSGNDSQKRKGEVEEMPKDQAFFPNPVNDSIENLVSKFEREVWQKPNMVIGQMGNLENLTVADIGAGYGYFAFRLLQNAGKVLAIDIDTNAINFMQDLKQQLPAELQSKFEARICTTDDPRLQKEEADLIIMVNTYSYLAEPTAYLKKLRNGLASGGRMLIIDFKSGASPIGPIAGAYVSAASVEEDLWKSGFRQIQTDTILLEYQYIITTTKS